MEEGLQEVVEAFDPGIPIAEASTPPSAWYRSPEVFSLERDTVFRNHWIAVGRAEEVAEPGHFLSGNLMGDPYVIVRGTDGELRAFDNVCRHHATTLLRRRS